MRSVWQSGFGRCFCFHALSLNLTESGSLTILLKTCDLLSSICQVGVKYFATPKPTPTNAIAYSDEALAGFGLRAPHFTLEPAHGLK